MHENDSKIRAALLLFLIILTTASQQILAQASKSDPVDVQAWYGLGLKKKLPKKWVATLAWQGRNYNNIQSHNGDYYSIEIAKELNRQFEVQAEYRLGLVAKGTYHRYSFGGTWQYKIHKLKLSSRLLIQNQLQDFDDASKLNEQSIYLRNRFGIKQKCTSWLDLYLQVEPIAKVEGRKLIDNIRNTGGVTFSIQKNIDLDLYYLFRPDYAKSYRRTYHVLGAEIQYTF